MNLSSNPARVLDAAEAEARFEEILDQVSAGESYLITRGSLPLACLSPASPVYRSKKTSEILAHARRLRAVVAASRDDAADWVQDGCA